MANYAFQLLVLEEIIKKSAGEEVKASVMEGSQQIKPSTKPEKVAGWIKGAMERLDSQVDESQRCQIMLQCGYNCAAHNHKSKDRARARRLKFASEEEFLQAELRHPITGTRLERDGQTLYQIYTPRTYTHPMRCYCDLVNKLPEGETISPTYCKCSLGYVQTFWEGVLGHPVEVEVLETALTGSEVCRFAVKLS
jgi:hypothetical protein